MQELSWLHSPFVWMELRLWTLASRFSGRTLATPSFSFQQAYGDEHTSTFTTPVMLKFWATQRLFLRLLGRSCIRLGRVELGNLCQICADQVQMIPECRLCIPPLMLGRDLSDVIYDTARSQHDRPAGPSVQITITSTVPEWCGASVFFSACHGNTATEHVFLCFDFTRSSCPISLLRRAWMKHRTHGSTALCPFSPGTQSAPRLILFPFVRHYTGPSLCTVHRGARSGNCARIGLIMAALPDNRHQEDRIPSLLSFNASPWTLSYFHPAARTDASSCFQIDKAIFDWNMRRGTTPR
ncbi:hypothetical protein DFH06DRAFT_1256121 [Mycena polygramma]|nr:hypothetical protein DFH06DRAFT_1256121 [Mycena polygramma]